MSATAARPRAPFARMRYCAWQHQTESASCGQTSKAVRPQLWCECSTARAPVHKVPTHPRCRRNPLQCRLLPRGRRRRPGAADAAHARGRPQPDPCGIMLDSLGKRTCSRAVPSWAMGGWLRRWRGHSRTQRQGAAGGPLVETRGSPATCLSPTAACSQQRRVRCEPSRLRSQNARLCRRTRGSSWLPPLSLRAHLSPLTAEEADCREIDASMRK